VTKLHTVLNDINRHVIMHNFIDRAKNP